MGFDLQSIHSTCVTIRKASFSERLEELKTQYPDFALFLSAFADSTGMDEAEAAEQLTVLAQEGYGEWVSSILDKYGRVLPELVSRGIIALPPDDPDHLDILNNPLYLRYGTFTMLVNTMIALTGNPGQAKDMLGVELEAALRIVDNFLGALERLLAADEDNELIGEILDKIPGPSMNDPNT